MIAAKYQNKGDPCTMVYFTIATFRSNPTTAPNGVYMRASNPADVNDFVHTYNELQTFTTPSSPGISSTQVPRSTSLTSTTVAEILKQFHTFRQDRQDSGHPCRLFIQFSTMWHWYSATSATSMSSAAIPTTHATARVKPLSMMSK